MGRCKRGRKEFMFAKYRSTRLVSRSESGNWYCGSGSSSLGITHCQAVRDRHLMVGEERIMLAGSKCQNSGRREGSWPESR